MTFKDINPIAYISIDLIPVPALFGKQYLDMPRLHLHLNMLTLPNCKICRY